MSDRLIQRSSSSLLANREMNRRILKEEVSFRERKCKEAERTYNQLRRRETDSTPRIPTLEKVADIVKDLAQSEIRKVQINLHISNENSDRPGTPPMTGGDVVGSHQGGELGSTERPPEISPSPSRRTALSMSSIPPAQMARDSADSEHASDTTVHPRRQLARVVSANSSVHPPSNVSSHQSEHVLSSNTDSNTSESRRKKKPRSSKRQLQEMFVIHDDGRNIHEEWRKPRHPTETDESDADTTRYVYIF